MPFILKSEVQTDAPVQPIEYEMPLELWDWYYSSSENTLLDKGFDSYEEFESFTATLHNEHVKALANWAFEAEWYFREYEDHNSHVIDYACQ